MTLRELHAVSLDRCDPKYERSELRDKYIERARHKLKWFLAAGYDLDAEAARCDEFSQVTLARFYSEVTNHEMSLTDRQFYDAWSNESADARKAIRFQNGHIRIEGGTVVTAEKKRKQPRIKRLVCEKCGEAFEAYRRTTKNCPKCSGLNAKLGVRLCASGDRCFGADRQGTPAPAASGKQYCTDTCRDCDKVRQKKALAELSRVGQLSQTLAQNPSNLGGI